MSANETGSRQPNRRDFLESRRPWVGNRRGGEPFGFRGSLAHPAAFPHGPVPRRTFGRSGIKLSTLSMGGMYDILNNRLMLSKALEWGSDYWDTAESYGNGRSEEGIGRWFARKPETRKRVFLVTKLAPQKGTDFTPRLDACLKRLSTDYAGSLFCAWHRQYW